MSPALPSTVARVRGLTHAFGQEEARKEVLTEVDLDLERGEIVILTGPSGSGKTTLLTLIGALRSVQQGSVLFEGKELKGLEPAELVEVRRRIGFIFQHHNLFDSLTALQNVRLALELDPTAHHDLDRQARSLLEEIGLGDRTHHKPDALSGGQRQRVAIARALVHGPRLVLADEPTAALDAETGRDVVRLLQRLARDEGCTTLLVTHDNRILDVADRIVNMVDGRIASDVQVARVMEICEFLSRTPIFEGHTPAALTEVAEKMQVETFAPGRTIFRQGQPGDKFYLVQSGAVNVVALREGKETRLASLGPGDFFGETALIRDEPRNASVVVQEDAVLYSLQKRHFQDALEGSRSLREQLLELLASRR